MSIQFTFLKSPRTESDTLVIPVYEDHLDSPGIQAFAVENGNVLGKAMDNQKKFKGKNGQTYLVPLYAEKGYARVMLLGLGKKEKIDALSCEKAGGALFLALKPSSAIHVTLMGDDEFASDSIGAAEVVARICTGLKLRAYKFDKYKTKKKDDDDDTPELQQVDVITDSHAAAESAFMALDHVTEGTLLARNLTSEPANELNPVTYAEMIRDQLKPLGVEVTIHDEKFLEKNGMGAFYAVGKGSAVPPRMVVMRWKGEGKGKEEPAVAFVGKGITFDTGGISLKPGKEMDLMKMDMGGSAAVVGLMKTLALRKSKADVVGVVGLAENMPSDRAYRPSDILKSMSGKTIEVLNTDAEGRLVLCDCLTYVQQTYKPKTVIDLATLTGAMMIALAFDYCGTFVNNDELWQQLEKASGKSGEKLWRMPLDEIWRKEMESQVADLKNLATSGSYGGACTAAGFLEHFVNEGVRWAHMDIAGTAWIRQDRPTTPKGASGFGVRVLNQFVADNFE